LMWTFDFFLQFFAFFVCTEQVLTPALFVLCGCCVRNILHRNALSGICLVIAFKSRFWDFNIADKAIVNHKPLGTALTGAFHLVERRCGQSAPAAAVLSVYPSS